MTLFRSIAQTLVEYGLMIVFISIVVLLMAMSFGEMLHNWFEYLFRVITR